MKSKKVILTTCAMVFCAFVGCVGFVSCNSDEDVNKALLENNELLKSCMKETGSAYCPLNIIPQQVLSKMTDEEYLLFDSINNKLYIDYSFLDSEIYKNNKDFYHDSFVAMYNSVPDSVSAYMYVNLGQKNLKKSISTLEQLAPTERNGLVFILPIKITDSKYLVFNIVYSCFVDPSSQNIYYSKDSHTVTTNPVGIFSGATEVNVQSNGLGIAIYTGRVIGEGVVSSYVLFDLKNPGC